jgi:hypothetical protein
MWRLWFGSDELFAGRSGKLHNFVEPKSTSVEEPGSSGSNVVWRTANNCPEFATPIIQCRERLHFQKRDKLCQQSF